MHTNYKGLLYFLCMHNQDFDYCFFMRLVLRYFQHQIIVQNLLSPMHITADTHAELQLFCQQGWKKYPKFTAFGFFEFRPQVSYR